MATTGRIIAESLATGEVLDLENVQLTRLERVDVSASAGPGQPPTWTLVDIRADEARAAELAAQLTEAILRDGGWYADLATTEETFVIFRDKVFRYPLGDPAGREEAVSYGRDVAGVPEAQLDWDA